MLIYTNASAEQNCIVQSHAGLEWWYCSFEQVSSSTSEFVGSEKTRHIFWFYFSDFEIHRLLHLKPFKPFVFLLHLLILLGIVPPSKTPLYQGDSYDFARISSPPTLDTSESVQKKSPLDGKELKGVNVSKNTKVTKASEAECNILGMAPSQDTSDHQDCYIFINILVGNPYKPLFATVTRKGPHPGNIFIEKILGEKKHLLLSEASKLQRETSQVNQFITKWWLKKTSEI